MLAAPPPLRISNDVRSGGASAGKGQPGRPRN